MRRALGILALLGALTVGASAAASENVRTEAEATEVEPTDGVPSPDGDVKAVPAAEPAKLAAKPKVDPHAFSNAVKSEVKGLFTFSGITLMFRPSWSGLTIRISGRF